MQLRCVYAEKLRPSLSGACCHVGVIAHSARAQLQSIRAHARYFT